MKKSLEVANPFQILEEEGEGKEIGEKEGQSSTQEVQTRGSVEETKEISMQDIMEEDEVEEMEFGDLDLDALEK